MVILHRLLHLARRRPGIVAAIFLAKIAILVVGLAVLPAAFPALGARSADALRRVVGVQAVSALESASNGVRDQLNQYRFGHGVALPQISWAAKGQLASATPDSLPRPASSRAASRSAKGGSLAPSVTVVTAAPQIGWQAFGPQQNGVPLMARAMLLVDPHRSY